MTAVQIQNLEVALLVQTHRTEDSSLVHTNLTASQCVCTNAVVRVAPRSTGNGCSNCGGMTVQTGTCYTCTTCGTSGGCG